MYNLHSPSHYLYLCSYEHVLNKREHILNKQQQRFIKKQKLLLVTTISHKM